MKRTLHIPFLTPVLVLSSVIAFAEGATSGPRLRELTGIADVKAPATFMFADKVVYQAGESIIVRLNQSANSNPHAYSYFVYFENLRTGQKLYHPGNQPGVVEDMFGNRPPEGTAGNYPVYNVPLNVTNLVIFGPGGLLGGARTAPATPGSYRYVMELRNSAGTEIIAQGFAPFAVITGVTTLSGDITSDRTLTNDRAYLLQGIVFVRSGATLTIEPGTIIFGDSATLGGLCIVPGGKINAVGTAHRPIVFTSSAAVGQRQPGDWFGIAIAGNAPINVDGGQAQVEGIEQISYGGNNPTESSGTMRYVRVEYAGISFTPTRQANGVYFNGVGSGTLIEFIHFHNNNDDNIEFFGGLPNIRYIYCSGGNDDQLDWVEGWRGKAQFVITHVFADTEGNRGIEADNLSSNQDASPRSSPTIYNMTIIGPRRNFADGEGRADHGVLLRRGTGGTFYNFIITGYGRDGIEIRDAATQAQAASGGLVFDNAILFDNGTFGADGVGNFANAATQAALAGANKILEVDPLLVDPFNRISPNYRPGRLSPALRIDVVKNPPDDGFFQRVDFVGGIGPGFDWLAGGWVYLSIN